MGGWTLNRVKQVANTENELLPWLRLAIQPAAGHGFHTSPRAASIHLLLSSQEPRLPEHRQGSVGSVRACLLTLRSEK